MQCSKCSGNINSNTLVMRAESQVNITDVNYINYPEQ